MKKSKVVQYANKYSVRKDHLRPLHRFSNLEGQSCMVHEGGLDIDLRDLRCRSDVYSNESPEVHEEQKNDHDMHLLKVELEPMVHCDEVVGGHLNFALRG